MCGIAGWLGGDIAPDERYRHVVGMCDRIRHRGPDDDGFYSDHTLAFGMRRLSIIDLSGGKQPIHNEDSSAYIVFNGEIYNFRELRADLEGRGHRFETQSDTEAILHGYEEYGIDVLSRLRGMFAFAIWDLSRRRLVLAVDRLGIKPLYVAETPKGILFGSELKCVSPFPWVSKEIDRSALSQFHTFGYIPAPRSIYAGVRKLRPGSVAVMDGDGPLVARDYWDLGAETSTEPETRVQERVRSLLRDAVESHLVADVPVGAFLSGGMDSSTVVALMSEVSPTAARTFTVGFNDRATDERAIARRTAERFGTNHTELVIEAPPLEKLPRILSYFDEPFGDASAVPTYYVCAAAREHVKVALSGDGGDEIFLGYTIFQGLSLAARFEARSRGTRAAAERLARLASWAPGWVGRSGLRLRASFAPLRDAFRSKLTVFRPGQADDFIAEEHRLRAGDEGPYDELERLVARCAPRYPGDLRPYEYALLRHSLPGDMLTKVDRMSMAHSLEVRVPLLDHRLVEYAFSLPVDMRLSLLTPKALLRRIMRNSLAPEVLEGRKRGFVVPRERWFRNELGPFAREVLSSTSGANRVVDRRRLEPLFARTPSGPEDGSSRLWQALALTLWECNETGAVRSVS